MRLIMYVLHSKNLTHTETCSFVKASVVPSPIKAKYSESLHALTNFSRIISLLIDYLVLYIWRCVLYPRTRYWVIQVRLVFRRVWTHDVKLPWNYFCLRYVSNCNILTTAMNQYIDYHLFLAISSLCWDLTSRKWVAVCWLAIWELST